MTDCPTTPERLSTLEAKTDRVLEELGMMRGSFVELEKHLGVYAKELERVKTELDLVKLVGTWIFAPLVGTLGMGAVLAIFYAIRK